LKEKLYFDDRTRSVPKTTLKNRVIEQIVQDGELVLKSADLME
jgi:hypothetical protein